MAGQGSAMIDLPERIGQSLFGRIALATLADDLDMHVSHVVRECPHIDYSDYLRAVIRTDLLERIADELGIEA